MNNEHGSGSSGFFHCFSQGSLS